MIDNRIEVNKIFWEVQSNHLINQVYRGGKLIPSLTKLERFFAKNIKGKTLHPFCNFGMNTFCLETYSDSVIGLDFSSTSISFANSYKKNINSNVNFIESDFFKFNYSEKFDTIFMSYGVLDWVIDLDLFFNKVNELLNDDGQLIILEYHSNFYKELIKEFNAENISNNLYEITWGLKQYDTNSEKSIYGEGGVVKSENIKARITLHDTDYFLQKSKEYGLKTEYIEYYDYLEFKQSANDTKISNSKYFKGEYKPNKNMIFGAILKK